MFKQIKTYYQKIENKAIKFFSFLIAIILFILLSPYLVQSQTETRIPVKTTKYTATINFKTTNNTATSSDTFTLNIDVDPGGQLINASYLFIGFASSSVTALDINTDNSFCSFFIEKSINQIEGGINIFCGQPYPGVATTSNIAQITFQKNINGLTSFEIKQNSQILANDGFGTNILKELNDIEILIN